jgi:uncharacterized protein YndB with AHSA1/START domain
MTPATQDVSDTGITSTADTTSGIVHVIADIAAPPERVFRALTDSNEVPKWWSQIATPEGGEMSDPRTPEPQTVGGEYITVDPPRLLEFTWAPSWDGFKVSTVRYSIEPTASGSRLTVTHSGFAGRPEMASSHGEGWVRVLGWLSAYIRKA